MSDVSKNLRQKLRDIAEIKLPRILDEITSVDGSRKCIVEVASGSQIETVFIPEAGRGTLCISSQSGCSLDCKFCATGKQGFDSNLSVAEIVGQLWWANKQLTNFSQTNAKRISNVVMMGMGEPLFNYENVAEAMRIIMCGEGVALSKRRILMNHLFPNVVAPIIVVGTMQTAHAIALEATLSFLGLGMEQTEPSLGSLIANGFDYIHSGHYWITIFPGVALLVTIVSINLVGDRLRDVLNPRLQR